MAGAVKYGSLPFAEAIRYLLDKTDIPTARWDDISGQAHDRYFMVAGAAKADLLADLHAAVGKAIEQGTTIETFRKDFAQIVAERGWHGWTGEGTKAGEAWRTRVIYATNLRTSYAAGRYSQMKALADRRPYWRYKHNDTVVHPRPHHLAWDGTVLRHDDPWWDTHYTPNGWGCRCYVETLAPRDLEREGITPGPAPESPIDPKTGAPVGIDKGWDHAPGKTRDLQAELREKAKQLPPGIGAGLLADVAGVEVVEPPRKRIRTRLREIPDRMERVRVAGEWIDQHKAKTTLVVKDPSLAAEEVHESVVWEGQRLSWPAGTSSGRARAAYFMADVVMEDLPRRLTRHVKEVVFAKHGSMYDPYYAKTYNWPTFQAHAAAINRRVTSFSGYILEIPTYIHEAGHLLAEGKYGSLNPPRLSKFGQLDGSGEPPPTSYAQVSRTEDFAECVRLYFTDRARFKEIAPQRFEVIDKLMKDDDYTG